MNGEAMIESAPMAPRAKPLLKDVAEQKAFEDQVKSLLAACYSNLGVITAMDKNYVAAAEYFEQAARWNQALRGLDHNWGRAAFAAQQYAQAVGPLSRFVQEHPEDVEARSMLGMSQYMTRDYEKALQTLRPIETQVSAVPSLAFAYADSLAKTGDFGHGIERLRGLEQADPENKAIHQALAEAYRKNSQPAEAEREAKLAETLAE